MNTNSSLCYSFFFNIKLYFKVIITSSIPLMMNFHNLSDVFAPSTEYVIDGLAIFTNTVGYILSFFSQAGELSLTAATFVKSEKVGFASFFSFLLGNP